MVALWTRLYTSNVYWDSSSLPVWSGTYLYDPCSKNWRFLVAIEKVLESICHTLFFKKYKIKTKKKEYCHHVCIGFAQSSLSSSGKVRNRLCDLVGDDICPLYSPIPTDAKFQAYRFSLVVSMLRWAAFFNFTSSDFYCYSYIQGIEASTLPPYFNCKYLDIFFSW